MVNFAEKDFEYDSLAITKNFVASPHVDASAAGVPGVIGASGLYSCSVRSSES